MLCGRFFVSFCFFGLVLVGAFWLVLSTFGTLVRNTLAGLPGFAHRRLALAPVVWCLRLLSFFLDFNSALLAF